jgi:RyR domain
MFNHPYITISSKKTLGDQAILAWMQSVKSNGPDGILSGVELRPDNKQLQFYKRKINGNENYVSVLSRHLTTEEAQAIAEEYNRLNPEGDFDITWSQIPAMNEQYQKLTNDLLKSIALEAAKKSHQKWLDKKLKEGWQYHVNHNRKNKTSPMIRDWDNLAEGHKKSEYDRMKSLLETLDEMNLILSKK